MSEDRINTSIDRSITNMDESIQLPRQNGELVFAAPWEARAFGLAVVLCERGYYPWKDFSEALAAEIRAAEKAGEQSTYYERWLRALRKLTSEKALLEDRDVEKMMERVAAEDEHAGEHDHAHPHPH